MSVQGISSHQRYLSPAVRARGMGDYAYPMQPAATPYSSSGSWGNNYNYGNGNYSFYQPQNSYTPWPYTPQYNQPQVPTQTVTPQVEWVQPASLGIPQAPGPSAYSSGSLADPMAGTDSGIEGLDGLNAALPTQKATSKATSPNPVADTFADPAMPLTAREQVVQDLQGVLQRTSDNLPALAEQYPEFFDRIPVDGPQLLEEALQDPTQLKQSMYTYFKKTTLGGRIQKVFDMFGFLTKPIEKFVTWLIPGTKGDAFAIDFIESMRSNSPTKSDTAIKKNKKPKAEPLPDLSGLGSEFAL